MIYLILLTGLGCSLTGSAPAEEAYGFWQKAEKEVGETVEEVGKATREAAGKTKEKNGG